MRKIRISATAQVALSRVIYLTDEQADKFLGDSETVWKEHLDERDTRHILDFETIEATELE